MTEHREPEDQGVVVKDDPYVRHRQRIAGEDPPSEVSTEFLASPVRPLTYPAGLPFLAGRESYTAESPDGSRAPQVRWRCSDPETLLAALTQVLAGDGWAPVPVSDLPVYLRHQGGPVFARAGAFCLVDRHDWEGGSVVSLHDLSALSGLL